jgi:hypothetical protein
MLFVRVFLFGFFFAEGAKTSRSKKAKQEGGRTKFLSASFATTSKAEIPEPPNLGSVEGSKILTNCRSVLGKSEYGDLERLIRTSPVIVKMV